MQAFVTALTENVTATSLWGALAPAAAIVGVGILVGFGYTVLRRAVSGIGKGKGRL
jgi:hypothetical protein